MKSLIFFYIFFSLFSSLCLVKLDHSKRHFCITQTTRLWMFFLYLMCTKMYLNGLHGNWINIVFKKKSSLYSFFFFVLKPWATWSALGAKQEGLTIVYFLNKLIVSCKEAVRFPFYIFFWGEGGDIFKLDSYFLFKLKGRFLYFTL